MFRRPVDYSDNFTSQAINHVATDIQRIWRGYQIRKMVATMRVLRSLRGTNKVDVEKLDINVLYGNVKAETPKWIMRRDQQMMAAARHDAATLIQKTWRGYRARERLRACAKDVTVDALERKIRDALDSENFELADRLQQQLFETKKRHAGLNDRVREAHEISMRTILRRTQPLRKYNTCHQRGESLPKINHKSVAPTHKESATYAKHLGIDLEKYPGLIWVAEQAITAALPDGWTEALDENGDVYFQNAHAKIVRFHPADDFHRRMYEKILASPEAAKYTKSGARKEDFLPSEAYATKDVSMGSMGPISTGYGAAPPDGMLFSRHGRPIGTGELTAIVERQIESHVSKCLALEKMVSPKEVLAMCNYLHIDPLTEFPLIEIARDALVATLPEGWTEHADADGYMYYYNNDLQQSTYTHPGDAFFKQKIRINREKYRRFQSRMLIAQYSIYDLAPDDVCDTAGRFWMQFKASQGIYYYNFKTQDYERTPPMAYLRRVMAAVQIQRIIKGRLTRRSLFPLIMQHKDRLLELKRIQEEEEEEKRRQLEAEKRKQEEEERRKLDEVEALRLAEKEKQRRREFTERARKHMVEKQDAAAVLIQKAARGYLARASMRSFALMLDTASAVKIQSAWRSYMVRVTLELKMSAWLGARERETNMAWFQLQEQMENVRNLECTRKELQFTLQENILKQNYRELVHLSSDATELGAVKANLVHQQQTIKENRVKAQLESQQAKIDDDIEVKLAQNQSMERIRLHHRNIEKMAAHRREAALILKWAKRTERRAQVVHCDILDWRREGAQKIEDSYKAMSAEVQKTVQMMKNMQKKRESAAATKIQSSWRGHSSRRYLRNNLKELQEQRAIVQQRKKTLLAAKEKERYERERREAREKEEREFRARKAKEDAERRALLQRLEKEEEEKLRLEQEKREREKAKRLKDEEEKRRLEMEREQRNAQKLAAAETFYQQRTQEDERIRLAMMQSQDDEERRLARVRYKQRLAQQNALLRDCLRQIFKTYRLREMLMRWARRGQRPFAARKAAAFIWTCLARRSWRYIVADYVSLCKAAALKLQCVIRGFLVRTKIGKFQLAILRLQSWWRGRQARKLFASRKKIAQIRVSIACLKHLYAAYSNATIRRHRGRGDESMDQDPRLASFDPSVYFEARQNNWSHTKRSNSRSRGRSVSPAKRKATSPSGQRHGSPSSPEHVRVARGSSSERLRQGGVSPERSKQGLGRRMLMQKASLKRTLTPVRRVPPSAHMRVRAHPVRKQAENVDVKGVQKPLRSMPRKPLGAIRPTTAPMKAKSDGSLPGTASRPKTATFANALGTVDDAQDHAVSHPEPSPIPKSMSRKGYATQSHTSITVLWMPNFTTVALARERILEGMAAQGTEIHFGRVFLKDKVSGIVDELENMFNHNKHVLGVHDPAVQYLLEQCVLTMLSFASFYNDAENDRECLKLLQRADRLTGQKVKFPRRKELRVWVRDSLTAYYFRRRKFNAAHSCALKACQLAAPELCRRQYDRVSADATAQRASHRLASLSTGAGSFVAYDWLVALAHGSTVLSRSGEREKALGLMRHVIECIALFRSRLHKEMGWPEPRTPSLDLISNLNKESRMDEWGDLVTISRRASIVSHAEEISKSSRRPAEGPQRAVPRPSSSPSMTSSSMGARSGVTSDHMSRNSSLHVSPRLASPEENEVHRPATSPSLRSGAWRVRRPSASDHGDTDDVEDPFLFPNSKAGGAVAIENSFGNVSISSEDQDPDNISEAIEFEEADSMSSGDAYDEPHSHSQPPGESDAAYLPGTGNEPSHANETDREDYLSASHFSVRFRTLVGHIRKGDRGPTLMSTAKYSWGYEDPICRNWKLLVMEICTLHNMSVCCLRLYDSQMALELCEIAREVLHELPATPSDVSGASFVQRLDDSLRRLHHTARDQVSLREVQDHKKVLENAAPRG
eukprot:Rmarinus@m.27216